MSHGPCRPGEVREVQEIVVSAMLSVVSKDLWHYGDFVLHKKLGVIGPVAKVLASTMEL